ncbi:MAG: hypothetical protein Q8O95_02230 [bacterium]|nr:hypothetical protein [bacterium]
MADPNIQKNAPEGLKKAPEAVKAESPSAEARKGLGESREKAAQVIAEGMQEGETGVESSERVSEVTAEGAEKKGASMGAGNQQSDAGSISTSTFVFDEDNLPPAPKMIQMIEKVLRSEIGDLMKEAKKHKGGWFRQPDYTKYNETMIEIRKKNVLLSRLLHMASEALKKIFLQMFGPKESA